MPALDAARAPMTTAPAASHHALSRSLSLAVAIAAAGAGAALAAQHPLSPPLALAGLAVGSLVFALWPLAWLVALPALLPWLGLAPWTGWISFEEFDLLLLAIAAGGHARLALRPPPGPGSEPAPLAMLLLLAWAAAVALAAWRGVADAGGWRFDLYEGYRGPTNVLRMAKPTLALWLLLPLWRHGQAAAGALASRRLALGLTLGLLGVSLACVWERWVYTGLADFSSDYRTVGSFWEMHVGGAALDASLALLLLTIGLGFGCAMAARSGKAFILLAGATGAVLIAACVALGRSFAMEIYPARLIACFVVMANVTLVQRLRIVPMMSSFLRGDITPEEVWAWRGWEASGHPALLLGADEYLEVAHLVSARGVALRLRHSSQTQPAMFSTTRMMM